MPPARETTADQQHGGGGDFASTGGGLGPIHFGSGPLPITDAREDIALVTDGSAVAHTFTLGVRGGAATVSLPMFAGDRFIVPGNSFDKITIDSADAHAFWIRGLASSFRVLAVPSGTHPDGAGGATTNGALTAWGTTANPPVSVNLLQDGLSSIGVIITDSAGQVYLMAPTGKSANLGSNQDGNAKLGVNLTGVQFFVPVTRFPNVNGANTVTAGTGIPPIFGAYAQAGLSALVANAINYTPGTSDKMFLVFVQVNVRTTASVNMDVTVTWKDATGAQTKKVPLIQPGGASVNNEANANGIYIGLLPIQIDNSATVITVSTTGTTETLYDFNAVLFQVL